MAERTGWTIAKVVNRIHGLDCSLIVFEAKRSMLSADGGYRYTMCIIGYTEIESNVETKGCLMTATGRWSCHKYESNMKQIGIKYETNMNQIWNNY